MILSFGGSIADEFHNADHDPLGQHAPFATGTPISPAARTCPYVGYFGPVHPSSSTSNGRVLDASSVNNHWTGQSVQSHVPSSYAFPSVDPHYHIWGQHSPPFSTSSGNPGGSDPLLVALNAQGSPRTNFDLSHTGSFLHPSFGHSSRLRGGSPVSTSMIPPYLGSNARTRDRVQPLQGYYQQQRPNYPVPSRGPIIATNGRPPNHRGMTVVASSPDHSRCFYFFPSGSSSHHFQEPDSLLPAQFLLWERDHIPSL
ncbi:hypothetical protein SAY87_015402 [Trapa incisa]|uniref:Uncharacterized protein n=1 Tax=Trapa incisa TaxID=236973 RepID=A0AAN7GQ36_9MYRT|nr:hypothetical protein SAY87_015402 [Trapa incisa]